MPKRKKSSNSGGTGKGKGKSLDIDLIRQAAAGRWLEILVGVGRLPVGSLDGRHHPCPKCGGTDRFRLVDEPVGAVYCNACLKSRNGDGFAAIQWALDLEFLDAAKEIADYLGLDATAGSGPRSKKKPAPNKHLEWRPTNEDTLMALWCRHKPGVTLQGIKAAGGRIARYRGRYTVVAFPVWGPKLKAADPVGWVICNSTGGSLPKFDASGQIEWIAKPKTTYGSAPGIIGDIDRLQSAAATWKLEGVSDLLAWLSMSDTPGDHAAVTNASGCKERCPKWVAEIFAGKAAYVLHDADKPGQEGALGWEEKGKRRPGWAEEIARYATDCRNVRLPYPVAETHGKDFRDWLQEGGTFELLRKLPDEGESISVHSTAESVAEKPDDYWRLARVNIERMRSAGTDILFWRGCPYTYQDGRYREELKDDFRAKLALGVKIEFDRIYWDAKAEYDNRKASGSLDEGASPPVARNVTPNLVRGVYDATYSQARISAAATLNTWLPTGEQRNYLAMRNGILDIDAMLEDRFDDCLIPHTSDWFSTVKLNYDFDPNATCPQWMEVLEHNLEGDIQRMNLVQEWAGYMLIADTSKHKFMMLEGEGQNGKSVYVAGIQAILGTSNCSYVPLEQFDDKYMRTQTLGKMANISTDAGEVDRTAEGMIKAFVAGDFMTFDRKYLPPIECAPTARLMIVCNNKPNFRDRTSGIWRRMIPVPWRVAIDEDRRVEHLDKAWYWIRSGEVPGMLIWALVGLYRLRQQGSFTTSDIVQEAHQEYQLDSNPAKRFLTECVEERTEEGQPGIKCSQLFKIYRKWHEEVGGRGNLGDREFGKEVNRMFPKSTRRKRGNRTKRQWVYFGIDFKEGVFSPEDLTGAYLDDFLD